MCPVPSSTLSVPFRLPRTVPNQSSVWFRPGGLPWPRRKRLSLDRSLLGRRNPTSREILSQANIWSSDDVFIFVVRERFPVYNGRSLFDTRSPIVTVLERDYVYTTRKSAKPYWTRTVFVIFKSYCTCLGVYSSCASRRTGFPIRSDVPWLSNPK